MILLTVLSTILSILTLSATPGFASTLYQYATLAGDEGSRFGSLSANIGDMNQDGFQDLLVGGHIFTNGGEDLKVISGLTRSIIYEFQVTRQDPIATNNYQSTISKLDDIDRDGVGDYIIGSVQTYGIATVHSGMTGAVIRTLSNLDSTTWGDAYGQAVSEIGDINGDGIGEIIVGALAADPGGVLNAGSVFVYSGSDFSLIRQFNGNLVQEQVGANVAGLSDLDGDQIPDIAIRIRNSGGENPD